MATIVVGVDGSAGSLHALRFAAEEARLRAARLHVVLAWEFPVSLYAGAAWPVPNGGTLGDFRSLAEDRLREALDLAAPALEGLEVERSLIEGATVQVLLEAARDAALLVVGTRGHGGFVGLLLGSVSQQVAHHASCPVLIVPEPDAG